MLWHIIYMDNDADTSITGNSLFHKKFASLRILFKMQQIWKTMPQQDLINRSVCTAVTKIENLCR